MGGSSRKYREPVPPQVYPKDWWLVNLCSFKKWAKTENIRWGFGCDVNYSQDCEKRWHPWTLGGRNMKALRGHWQFGGNLFNDEIPEKHSCRGDEEDVDSHFSGKDTKYAHLVIAELGQNYCKWSPVALPYETVMQGLASSSSLNGFKNISVIGYNNDHIVLQVVRETFKMEFYVLYKAFSQLCTSTVYGVKSVFVPEMELQPFMYEAHLSPDCSKVLISPCQYHSEFAATLPLNVRNLAWLVDTKTGKCTQECFKGEAVFLVYAFDPRFNWNRIAIGTCGHLQRRTVVMYDIPRKVALVEADPTVHQKTRNLVFSPDGAYLASMLISICTQRDVMLYEGVLIYDSDTLTIVKRIHTPDSYVASPMVPLALFPMFSWDGRYMAMVKAERPYTALLPDVSVAVYTVPVSVSLNLQTLCRYFLLQVLRLEDIDKLPLPTRLKYFLKFKPIIS